MKRISLTFLLLILFCCYSTLFARPGRARNSVHRSDNIRQLELGDAITTKNLDDASQVFPARGGSVDWGLALSGGGIRSGAFSIGVMKALYQTDLWDKLDVISSVSGGGFGSYRVFKSYDLAAGKKFGAAVFDDDLFVRDLCRLEQKSDFFPFGKVVDALFKSRNGAFNSYEGSIRRTFSSGSLDTVKINYLKDEIAAAKVPFFIINTAVVNEKDKKEPIRNVFELAPTFLGSEKFKYHQWNADDKQVLNLSEGMAISAAAIKCKLSRKIPNDTKPPGKFDLADGGLLENLGALALIRRGLKNVIIVDAENDPAYKFESYLRLQKWLDSQDIKFEVHEIETFLRQKKNKRFTTAAVSKGHAKRSGEKPIDSTIYYIKMSQPASIFSSVDENSQTYKDGQGYAEKRDLLIKNSGNSCDGLAGMKFDENLFIYRVRKYSHFLNDEWFWRGVMKILPNISYNFPQTTTFDQSFDQDQLEAFVGLGYLQAKELKITE
jgi:hypothetical protein